MVSCNNRQRGHVAAAAAAVCGPGASFRMAVEPRLVLHFDVNETIMVGDPAGGDTFEDCLNKICAKSAVVRTVPETERATSGRWTQWTWYDGTPLDPDVRAAQGLTDPPPLLEDWEFGQEPAGCSSFYKTDELKKAFAKSFTEDGSPGVIYRGIYEKMEKALRCGPEVATDRRLCHDGVHHFLLPAFFFTLTALRDAGRQFSLVIRTFGTDGPKVVEALQAFSEGAHSFAAVPEIAASLSESPQWTGSYRVQGEGSVFVLQSEGGETVSNEAAVVAALTKPATAISAVCCQDDYKWWRGHDYSPSAGKPLWVTIDETSITHPIFFDDNIHNDAVDSIVAVRVATSSPVGEESGGYAALTGEGTIAMQGLVLKRTPTWCPILDEGWFVHQIGVSEANLAAARQDGRWERFTQMR